MAADRLVDRITETDKQVAALARSLSANIVERMNRKHGRHAPARPETLIDLESLWRTALPQESRLGLVTDWHRNRTGKLKGLTISDARRRGCETCVLSFSIGRSPSSQSTGQPPVALSSADLL
jgi:hypothetical protein